MTALILPTVAVLIFMAGVMATGWAVQRATDNGGWIDVFWTFGTGACGVAMALGFAGSWPPNPRQLMVAGLVALWSIRLGSYIAIRVARSDREDVRYASLKQEWGEAYQARMFGFMQVQGPVTALLSLAVLLAASRPGGGLDLQDLLGGAVMLLAIVGEGVADRQMAQFRADPANRGKVCDTGLWGLSRHPNYAFEWLVWTAYPIIAVQPAQQPPIWALALLGPAFMYVLLRFMTGVPPLEAAMLQSRGEAFRDYQARVPAFFPLPVRRTKAPD